METRKIKSNYLGMEFDVPMYDIMLNGQDTSLVPHDALEDIILNQIPAEYGVKYDKVVEKAERDHAVVKCTITDAKGRRVQCLGESVAETLYSDIARGIPVTMAEIRAFDRAAIRYLDLPGKVYSKDELGPCETKPAPQAEAQAQPAPVTVEEVKPNLEEELPLEQAAPANDASLDIVISIGKYKNNPQKLSDITSDTGWIKFNVTSFKPQNEEEQAQLDALKAYAEKAGIK